MSGQQVTRYVLTARLVFTDYDAAQRAADRIQAAAGTTTAVECVIEERPPCG